MSAQAFDTGSRDQSPPKEPSTADLLKEGIEEARELVRLEVELAKHEALGELRELRAFTTLAGAAFAAVVLALAALVAALVVAAGAGAGGIAAAVFFVIAAVLAYQAKGRLSESPMRRTRHRLEAEARDLRARVT